MEINLNTKKQFSFNPKESKKEVIVGEQNRKAKEKQAVMRQT